MIYDQILNSGTFPGDVNTTQTFVNNIVPTGTVVSIQIYGTTESVNVYELDVRVNNISQLMVADMVRT